MPFIAKTIVKSRFDCILGLMMPKEKVAECCQTSTIKDCIQSNLGLTIILVISSKNVAKSISIVRSSKVIKAFAVLVSDKIIVKLRTIAINRHSLKIKIRLYLRVNYFSIMCLV